MPKLATQHFRIQTEDRECFAVKVQPSVSASGIFYCDPPTEIIDSLRLVAPHGAWTYMKNRSVLSAPTLEGLRKMIQAALEAHHAGTVEESWVLRYRFRPDIAFYVTKEGIEPNGQLEDHTRAGKWWKPKTPGLFTPHANDNCPTVSVGLAGVVMKRTVTTRSVGKTIRMTKGSLDELREAGMNAAADLNRWVGLGWGFDPEPGQGTFDVPYREALARFIHSAMTKFAELAMAFDEIMASPETLERAALNNPNCKLLTQ
jgi:hypothetical protein